MTTNPLLIPTTDFVSRHLGPRDAEIDVMLERCGCDSLDGLAEAAIPSSIRLQRPLAIGAAAPPHELLAKLREIASRNQLHRSYIGMGYHNCHTPPVIQRSVFENPGWYTQYTPYQAEISQGRLEALLIFQTMIGDLTGLPLANASLLDEATAAAEAMTMCRAIARSKRTSKSDSFYVADSCHPQTIAVLRTRAKPVGIDLQVGPLRQLDPSAGFFGVLVQYPDTDGRIEEPEQLAAEVHETGGYLAVACDLLALTLLRPPGEFGADIAVGSAQRFGVPLGCGGPHAAFLSTTEDNKRQVPGRIVGVSRDSEGKPAYRLALQTREQHIRRDRATSNICTAQVLTAIMSAFYAVHHGPEGLRQIAERVHGWTGVLASGLRRLGYQLGSAPFFDTLRVELDEGAASTIVAACTERGINLRRYPGGPLGISLDETVTARDVADLLSAFAGDRSTPDDEFIASELDYPKGLARDSDYLTHPHFHCYRSEHEMLRYLSRLQGRDLSLVNSMIPLGSCTMKLNAAAEMLPLSWPEFADVHPFAPPDQLAGYHALFEQLEQQLAEITGLPAVSLQPNSGAQGEYAGLLVIRQFHEANGDSARNVCLIPMSAHGTNPASAVMTGFDIVAVACDGMGNIDVGDLAAKAEKYKERLGALMVTYPSTHGVFESAIQEICSIVHKHGGRVYLDGANMNAQVGLCRPGDYGADVCHLNLHKTFAMPHGGGGPGVGPIAASEELAPFLPGHPLWRGRETIGPVAAAPFGSPLLLPISWLYIGLMGGPGLERASQVAILNANYMEQRLDGAYEIVFRGESGYVAHEFIIDCRPFKKSAGIVVDDVAKRLMDFGFHAPTMSFPVAGTLMIEPTESESKAELDRFCDAMIAIREEIRDIEEGRADREDNPLKNAPHTALAVTASEWTRPYSREQAAYPASWLREHKFWPPVARVDNPYGDRHLFCCCPLPVE